MTTASGRYHIEDRQDSSGQWVWRVTDVDAFHDGWVGDYATKREAMAAISRGVN